MRLTRSWREGNAVLFQWLVGLSAVGRAARGAGGCSENRPIWYLTHSVAGFFIFCNAKMTTRCGFLDCLFSLFQPLLADDVELKSLTGVNKVALCCELGKREQHVLAVPTGTRRARASCRTASRWPVRAQAGSSLATGSALQPVAGRRCYCVVRAWRCHLVIWAGDATSEVIRTQTCIPSVCVLKWCVIWSCF